MNIEFLDLEDLEVRINNLGVRENVHGLWHV
jgi:hypothetical protein